MLGLPLGTKRIKLSVNRVFYGWWIVAGGFSLQMVIGALMIHSFTAYFPFLQAHFGWSRTMLSGAFALTRAESGLLGPLQGWLIDKFGARMMVRIGVLLFGIGFMLFSQIDSVLGYYVTFTIMSVGSSIAGFLTVATTVVNWFEKKRSIAMGIAMTGFGIGGLFVPVIAWALTTLGWRPTAFFSGVLVILIGLPLAQLMRHRPEQYGKLPAGELEPTNSPSSIPGEPLNRSAEIPAIIEADPNEFTAREAMRTSAFSLLRIAHAKAL